MSRECRDVAHVVIRLFFTFSEVWVQCQVKPREIYCAEIGTGTGLFTEHFDLPLSLTLHRCSIITSTCMLLLRGRKTEKNVNLPRNKIPVEIRKHYLG